MKLCTECINAENDYPRETSRAGYWSCSRFMSYPRISPVDGSVMPAERGRCVILRRNGGICGPDGKGWQSRTPAKAIEAGTAETGTGSVHESAVPQGFAQEQHP